MDKNSVIGLLLVAALVIGWLFYTSMTVKPETHKQQQQTQTVAQNQSVQTQNQNIPQNAAPAESDSSKKNFLYGSIFSSKTGGNENIVNVENDLFKGQISSKGFAIKRWELKKFKTWDGYSAQLIWDENSDTPDKNGELFLKFTSAEGRKIDSRDLDFVFDNPSQNNVKISGKDSAVVSARVMIAPNKAIIRKYVFYGDKYEAKTYYEFQNLESALLPNASRFDLVWQNGVRYQENNSVDESSYAESSVSMNGSIETLDVTGKEPKESNYTGNIDFAAIKNKYFAVAILPINQFDGTVELKGRHISSPYDAKGVEEHYSLNFKLPYRGGDQTYGFRVFLGPLDYDLASSMGLHSLVNLGSGWLKWIVRPICEYFMLPIFRFVHEFIPNYGIAIIIFTLMMKLLLYPLSITQMRSSQKMALLGPELQKLRERYPDDTQTQQKEQMKLYSEYGVNPASGCLPLLLQLPILYALWALFSGSLDLRQAPFGLWISDLSRPDVILNLPFTIPFINLTRITGLALLMGITMFIQQKMTVTDPKQKSMVYFMPIMFTLMFASFPAGLNLYYFMFNLFSIAQQFYVNKLSPKRMTLEQLKKAPKKESWLQKKMREAQDIAEQQGKTIPGQKKFSQDLKNLSRPQNKNQKKK